MHLIADAPVEFFGLPPDVTPTSIELETSAPVDDILAATSAGGILLPQCQEGRLGHSEHVGLVTRWGTRKVKAMKRRDVREVLDEITPRAPIMANRTLALVRQMFNFAIEHDWLETNPCHMIKQLAPEKQRERVLSEDEIRQRGEEQGLWRQIPRLSRQIEFVPTQPVMPVSGASRSHAERATPPRGRASRRPCHDVYRAPAIERPQASGQGSCPG
ncbi:MAG: hypothetical protein ABI603_09325 [Acidobacteriota bacterium]